VQRRDLSAKDRSYELRKFLFAATVLATMTDQHRDLEAPAELLFRSATIESRAPAAGETDTRTASMAFSSEAQVPRWFGGEILDHSPASVRMDFLASGRAPLLVNHDIRGRPVGVVTDASIGSDRKGRAAVRFGSSSEADSVLRDVRDGILTNVSVGYRVHDMKLESSGDDGDIYRITDWEPLEVSLVAIPADKSVGVGRSPEFENLLTRARALAHPENSMAESNTSPGNGAGNGAAPTRVELTGAAKAATDAERERGAEIRELGARHNLGKLADEHVAKGTSIELFRGHVLEKLNERGGNGPIALGPSPSEIGLTDREVERFSLRRLILAHSDSSVAPVARSAPFEFECCATATKAAEKSGHRTRGFVLPNEVSSRIVRLDQTRTLTASGGVGSGGALVQSTVLASQYVPPNYNVPIVVAAGARVLTGLQGNILIPAMTAGKSGTWINRENTVVSSADPTFAQIPLSPKDVGSVCDISRRLLLQGNPAVDGLVRDDIAIAIANTIDQGAINGSGASGQPQGLIGLSGTTTVALGTNGAALTWLAVTSLLGAVGAGNRMVDGAPIGFVTNWQCFAHGLRQLKLAAATIPAFIFEYLQNLNARQGVGTGSCLGFPLHTSQNVPANLVKGTSGAVCSALILGNWSDMLVGEWGVLDMLVDPYTFSNTGAIRVRAFMTVDVNVRYPAAFALIKDMLTTT
jgi:HK97 family phage major capsid protein/HK97 family phage prohead protease